MEKKIIAPKITTNLWFDKQAEEAVDFYISVFKNARKTGRVSHYAKDGHVMHGLKAGAVMTLEFEIEGQTFMALNAGPIFKFNEAVSFIVNCENQGEVDYYWEKLSQGGDEKAQVCGWLKDKFGLSWQIVPTVLQDMLQDKDAEKTNNVMAALMKMQKLDIAALKEAYEK
ncbi:MAG: hypothetical protein JWP37_177 [Mucilaginibacter sp.]|nr:hypothetical protein [Mucilaginibacter sp.]